VPTPLTSRKATPPNETREALRLVAQRNLFRFAKEMLGYEHMTESFHLPLLLWSQRAPFRKKLHLVPRGHFKTSGLTVAKNIQRILNDPNVRILIASNKAQNAEAMLAEMKGKLASDFLIWLFPEILVKDPEKHAERWTTGSITVKRSRRSKECTVETNGVEGELTSKHYEAGTFDDLVGLENSQTREERQKVKAWIEAAHSLVDQPSLELAWHDYIGTTWDADDAWAWLLKKAQTGDMHLGVYVKPCWVPDPTGEEVPGYGTVRSSFPERFTVSALTKLRKEIGGPRFAAQYLLNPVDDTDAVFHRKPVDEKHPWGIPAVKPRSEQPPVESLWLAMTIDPAISQKGWADYSALSVCGWDHQNRQHVLWLRWGKWSETQLIDEAYLAYNHFLARGKAPVAVGIEAIAFQRLLLHLFTQAGEKRGQYLPIVKLERDTKNTKQTRQLVLEPGWNGGDVVLYDDLPALEDLLDMAARFRVDKELTRDDLLDVLADNHQLRIRPHAPSSDVDVQLAALDPQDADRARAYMQMQERRKAKGAEPLDAASLRMSYSIRQRMEQIEQEREYQIAGDAW
jgi:hypothetical protein